MQPLWPCSLSDALGVGWVGDVSQRRMPATESITVNYSVFLTVNSCMTEGEATQFTY